MTELRKAAEMALEALEWNYGTDLCDIENCTAWLDKMNATISALRQALAEEALDRMAAENQRLGLYDDTAPPKKEWVGLTTAEVIRCQEAYYFDTYANIEAELKEKNT